MQVSANSPKESKFHPLKIKSRLNSGTVCSHLAQNLSYSSLLHKNINIKMHRTIILPVVLCGFESWSLTLSEETRPTLFERGMLRTAFGPKRDEVTREWRRLHNEKVHALCCSSNIICDKIKKNEMGGAGSTYEDEESFVQGFGGKT